MPTMTPAVFPPCVQAKGSASAELDDIYTQLYHGDDCEPEPVRGDRFERAQICMDNTWKHQLRVAWKHCADAYRERDRLEQENSRLAHELAHMKRALVEAKREQQ